MSSATSSYASASGSGTVSSSSASASSSPAIAGTTSQNISAIDLSQLTYTRTWRSDYSPGYYQAYSNDSEATVTFSFTGVAVAYFATKKADRGGCLLTVDSTVPYTIDLYNDSGYSEGEQLIWYSGTLVYGKHNVTISQYAPDGRFGYYPYLASESWIQVVPTDVAAYTATEILPSPTQTYVSSYKSGPDKGAVAGGVVGGIVAAVLLGFLVYLWRRDKARRERSEGLPVQKVKKSEGKMAIEDEPDTSSGGHGGGYGGHYGAYGIPGGYSDPYAGYPAYSYGYGPPPSVDPPYSSSPGPPSAWSGYPVSQHYAPPHSVGSTGDAHSARYPPQTGHGLSPSSPGFAPPQSRGSLYDSAYHSGGASDGGSAPYPYHVQGTGAESRSYAVPELD
ncbi:hypothetical protein JCM8547_002455 [Rhodosporidiobolus lusitaniae]